VLHYCGYKDKSTSEAAIMRSKEEFYLQQRLD
jgi:probable rRNA maturation factor